MIVVVTGGRDYADAERVHAELDRIHAEHGIYAVAHGACPAGADAHADSWVDACGGQVLHWRFPAHWSKHGRSAGTKRNGEMLRQVGCVVGAHVVVLAFPGGRGTADCVRQARKLGLRVEEVGR